MTATINQLRNMTDKLWVTDEEIIDRSGVPRDKMRRALQALDADKRSGFPRRQPLYDNRRYWPAVQDYWLTTNRIKGLHPQADTRDLRTTREVRTVREHA